MALPGDDLVPAPMVQATHAVTINAPPQTQAFQQTSWIRPGTSLSFTGVTAGGRVSSMICCELLACGLSDGKHWFGPQAALPLI